MKADVEILRNLKIAKQLPGSKMVYVRLIDIPEPFRSEFLAWMTGSACPVIEGEDPRGCAYDYDFDSYRRDRINGRYGKWGVPPWEIYSYRPPKEDE